MLVCIVGDMEDDVNAVEQFAVTLAYISEILDDGGCVVQRLAWTIKKLAQSIEERRGELFRLLHPCRAEFEKTGWPGGKVAS